MDLKSTLLVFSLSVFHTSLWANDQNRVALIIANNDYKNISGLKNPPTDAKGVALRLRKLGFRIIRPIRTDSDIQANLDLGQILVAQVALAKAAQGAEMVFLYYAGHGASLGDKRDAHIIPVNVSKPKQNGTSLKLLKKQSYSLDELLKGLNNKAQLTVAVFDACREIPELEQTKGMFSDFFGSLTAPWRGLGRIKQGQKRIIAYSGAMGQLVADGDDDSYSPYTQRLLEVLDSNPYQEVGDLFRDVAIRVKSFTGQNPVVEIQAVPPRTFYFAKKNPPVPIPPPVIVVAEKTKQTTYAFTVKTIPNTAKIRILNIKPAYKNGIRLEAGKKYHIEVSKPDYITKKQWITLENEDKQVEIRLDKAPIVVINKNAPTMVFIKGGSFQMGCSGATKECDDDEKKVHQVKINDFSIGQTEVTVKQYLACVKANVCRQPIWLESKGDFNIHTGSRNEYKALGASLMTPNHPIVGISWHDATAYAKWLGKSYRLPTEAEWEYAARAGGNQQYSWGNHAGRNKANCNDCNDKYKFTAPVRSFKAYNGLYDMQGNVWEWVCSAYSEQYNGNESTCTTGDKKNTLHVIRGGSWYNASNRIRVSDRFKIKASQRLSSVGFRVVKRHF